MVGVAIVAAIGAPSGESTSGPLSALWPTEVNRPCARGKNVIPELNEKSNPG